MTKQQKQVMDMCPSKGMTEAQSDEHKRNWNDKKWSHAKDYGNYDRTREHLNFEVVKGRIMPVDKQKSIPTRIKEMLAGRGIKDPNEGKTEPTRRTVVNIIFGGSTERMREIAFGNQSVNFDKEAENPNVERSKDIEQWALDVYNFAAAKWGEENIAGFVVHLDETNPHAHCALLTIVEGEISYKKMFAGKDPYEYQERMRKLHGEFAEVSRLPNALGCSLRAMSMEPRTLPKPTGAEAAAMTGTGAGRTMRMTADGRAAASSELPR